MAYKNNKLSKVVFQINYSSISEIKDSLLPEIIKTFETTIGVEHTKTINKSVNIIIKENSTNPEYGIFTQWNFVKDPLILVINDEWIHLTTTKYVNYNAFHKLIDELLTPFICSYTPNFNRIALRYINNINFSRGNTFDFANYINDSLIAPTILFKDSDLSRSMGVMVMNHNNGINTKFQYGFFNSEFPNKINKREFILDYDCSIKLNGQVDNIKKTLLDLRNNVNSLFENSILEGFRKELNK